ncbi:hypothetical protein Cni_G08504 [Canna indica]|uniref:DJ-1/PfpI domain-containing protein n=1 Tax=Canna indica TaxID=4628 RepID=A0AAQ3K0V4_9LILI|nr:hypothetical protein Cni_G08504 [Canna indica]
MAQAGARLGHQAQDSCSPHPPQSYNELRGHNFTLNATFDEIDQVNKYDGLIIPGGRSPEYLAMNESVVELARKFSDSAKPIASICHGLLILAAGDLVKDRKCTAFPTLKPLLIAAGAQWVEADTLAKCASDGNLITGVTYLGHAEYIRLFVEALGGSITGSDKRILFLCGDYMEDYEVRVPFQSLEALGCHVDAVSPKKGAGESCLTAVHDYEGEQTYSEKPGYDALVIPGGRASKYLALNEKVICLVKEFMSEGKLVASVGQGQRILSAAGVLKGRKCTAHPTAKLDVVLAGATWLEPEPIDLCFTDGNLVTCASWHGHAEFITQLMALLGIKVTF